MKIIVIIVTYNGIKWADKCFSSLRESSIPVKTIVIDNKSTDKTVEYIQNNYPEIHLIQSQNNLGFGKANNIGFEYAIKENADYVFLLNQDAWIFPDTIEKLLNQMQKNPNYGILSPVHLNGTEKELDYRFKLFISREFNFDLNNKKNTENSKNEENNLHSVKFVNAALWLISKKCLEKVGGFCPLFPHYGEDNDYMQRVEYHKLKKGVYTSAFGVHDRPQKTEKRTNEQLKMWGITRGLMVLSDINNSFLYCMMLCVIHLSLFLVKDLNVKNFYIIFSVGFVILKILPKTLKYRSLSKKSSYTYLDI